MNEWLIDWSLSAFCTCVFHQVSQNAAQFQKIVEKSSWNIFPTQKVIISLPITQPMQKRLMYFVSIHRSWKPIAFMKFKALYLQNSWNYVVPTPCAQTPLVSICCRFVVQQIHNNLQHFPANHNKANKWSFSLLYPCRVSRFRRYGRGKTVFTRLYVQRLVPFRECSWRMLRMRCPIIHPFLSLYVYIKIVRICDSVCRVNDEGQEHEYYFGLKPPLNQLRFTCTLWHSLCVLHYLAIGSYSLKWRPTNRKFGPRDK